MDERALSCWIVLAEGVGVLEKCRRVVVRAMAVAIDDEEDAGDRLELDCV